MDTLKINWPVATTSPTSTQHPLWRPWWERLLLSVPRPFWPLVIAGVVAMALLGAFQKVVAGSVQQGELRRQAETVRGSALWRCHALRVRPAVDACLLQLNATDTNNLTRPSQTVAAR